jgi:3-methyladenine DNA glycosylase/8-oxoguanine DNA glycosylase
MKLTLPARQPFIFRSIIHSHGWYQLAPLYWEETTATLRLPLQLASSRIAPLMIQTYAEGVTVSTPGRLANAEKTEVTECVAWMFNLDADFDEFYGLADQEPRLAHCRPQGHGRMLRSPTMFEDVVKVMATTNIQWGGAKRLVRQLVDAFGESLDGEATIRAFPTVERIAATDETTLRTLGWGYRSPYLLKLARGIAEGSTDLDSLRHAALPTPELRKALLRLPGIGPYAAATLLGLLGQHDYIGVDTEAVSLVSKHFYGGGPVGKKEIEAIFGRWGKFKSLAYWFWDWRGAQQAPMEAWEIRKEMEIHIA